MKDLTIGFDAKRLFNNLTGLGNYSRTLVHNLEKSYPDSYYVLFSEKVRDNPDTEEFKNSSKYKIVGKSGFGRKFWRIFSIRKDLKKQNLDIYHGLSHDLPFGKKPKGMKYVVTIHDVCFKTFPEMFAPIERIIYKYKYSNSLKKADKIVAISQSTKNDIIKFFPFVDQNKIEVVYQAINPVYYTLSDIKDDQELVKRYGVREDFILYVGSINSRKNLMGVVKAYLSIDQQKRLPLVVVGTGGAYKEKVLAFAQANDLDQYITYLDNVTLPDNLRAFYRCAKMLVYPSFYEGFGLPVAEALLCETPVITSSISSLPEAGGEFALYADPNSDVDIATAISYLCDNEEEAKRLGREGREFVIKTFDPTTLTDQIYKIYRDLVK